MAIPVGPAWFACFMRGIAGIVRFDHGPVEPAEIDRMVRTMAICPTDRVATWCEGSAGLAHLVKDTVPEDCFEAQPLVGPGNRFVLVTDATLTNREEIAAALGRTAAETATWADSALVAAAYEKWGEQCLQKLEGRLAIVTWHPQERRLFAAVDAFAFRPLYYWRRHDTIAFASTLRGLLSLPFVSRELNVTVFADGFSGMGRISEETLYRDIACVPRGSILQVDAIGVRTARHWRPNQDFELRLRSDDEYLEAFRVVLTRAVQGSLRSCGEVGVMISGGLDSSAVAAVAAPLLAARNQRLQAFHLRPTGVNRFVGELRDFDESRYVKDLQDFAPEIDFHFLAKSQQPLMDAAELSQLFEDEQTPAHALPLRADREWERLVERANVRTLLNGLGGNQLVSPQIRGSNYLGHLAATGRWLRLSREIRGVHRTYGTRWRALARETLAGTGWRPAPVGPLPFRLRLLHPDLIARAGLAERFHENRAGFTSRTARNLRGIFAHELSETMVQHAGVSPSVISRGSFLAHAPPLFDRRLNEFCLSLPLRQQFRDGSDRRLLREVTRGMLPDSVRLRITRGFAQAFGHQAFAQHRAEIAARVARILSHPAVAAYFNLDTAGALKNRIADPACSPQEQIAATSLLGWGEFLAWRLSASQPPGLNSPGNCA